MMSEDPTGNLVEQYVSHTLEFNGELVCIENIPARVDLETGEQFFALSTLERLHQIILAPYNQPVDLDRDRQSSFSNCLPSDIQLTDIVSVTTRAYGVQIAPEMQSTIIIKKVTVAQVLTKLQAYCLGGKLVDGNGREIQFYRLTGVGDGGAFPIDGGEILAKQAEKLNLLHENYTVIEMDYHTHGYNIPSSAPVQPFSI
jgi:hypothetical protein